MQFVHILWAPKQQLRLTHNENAVIQSRTIVVCNVLAILNDFKLQERIRHLNDETINAVTPHRIIRNIYGISNNFFAETYSFSF